MACEILVPWPGIEPMPPEVKAWNFNHWTIREVPIKAFLWRQWHPTPVLLPGKSQGRRTLVGWVHGVAKSQARLSDFTFTFHFHALEKEMATHSSVLAWRIPGKGEPCGLPSMGSHRVGHDWSNLAAAAAFFLEYHGISHFMTLWGCL